MRKTLFFIPLLLLVFASCSKKQEHFKIIPANAPVVLVINTPGIIKKVTLNSISNLSVTENWNLFKDSTTATTKAGKLLKNTADAGIDTQDEIFGWVSFSGVKPWYTTCFALKSDDKLALFVKDSLKSEIKAVGQFQTAELDSTTLLAWNKYTALVLYSDSQFGVDSLKGTLTGLPDAEKKAENIGDKDVFKKIREDGHDASIWVRSELFKNNLPAYLSALGYVDGIMYADFNSGQIEFSFEQTVKDKDLQAYTGSLNPTSSLSDLSVFSKDKLIGAFAGSVNFTSSYMLKNKDSLDKALAPYEVTATDVYKSFTGDFAVGIQGIQKSTRVAKTFELDDNFELIEKMDTIEDATPLVTAIFKLKDEHGAMAILNKLGEKMGFTFSEGHYSMKIIGAGETVTHVYIKNGSLVISNDASVWGGNNNGAELTKEIKTALQQPMSFYLNYQLLHKADFGNQNPFRDEETKELLSKMDFMSLGVKEEKPNVYKITLDLSLLNKDENALIQIMKYRRNSQKKTSDPKANV